MLPSTPDLRTGVLMMKSFPKIFAFVLFASASTPALAASATPEEAQRLTGVLQTYLGKEPGVVTITPAGEAYDVKIDFAPFLAKVNEPNFSAEISPFEMKLADQGGGKWLVTQDSPFSVSARIPGQFAVTARVGAMKGTAVFDESLPGFTSSTTEVNDFSFNETITPPGAGPVQVTYGIKSVGYETTAAASGAGAVDGTMRTTMSGFFERISVPASPASPMAMDINASADTATSETTVKGMKNRAIYQLISWFIAHPSEASIKASQPEMKAILGASLPVFENMSGTGTAKNITVTTPVGPIGIANLGFDIGLTGFAAEGELHEGFTMEGLSLPPGLVPPWAVDLVPDKLALDFKVADFDLAAPAKIVIDNMDLSNKDPIKPEFGPALLIALLPKGAVTLSMGAGKLTGKLFDVGFEGTMRAGPFGNPTGEATVRIKGIDRVMEALKSAPPDVGGQAIPGIIAAKGMAKTEADGSLSWKIENTTGGTVLINGLDVSKMGGG